MRLAVILVNWRNEQRTLRAIEAVRGWGAFKPELIVVDNESTEGSRKALGAVLAASSLVTSKVNRGYGGGNNLGIARALGRNADFVLLLNSDAEIAETGVIRLLARLARDPAMGAIGPVIHERQKDSVICLIGGKDIAQNVATRVTADPAELATVDGYPLIEVDYVPGAVLLARRGLFETIGLLDEQYFFSGEIADFGKRARDKGYRLCVDLDVHATHNVRETHQELRDTLYIYYSLRNRMLYARKHYPGERGKYLALWAKVCLLEAGRAITQKRFGKARAFLLALAHAATNRFGNQNDSFIADPPIGPSKRRRA